MGRERIARLNGAIEVYVAKIKALKDSIDATEVQRAAVQDAKERLRERALELRADGREARATGLAELRKDEPDGKVLHGLVDQRAEAITAVAHDVVEAVLAIHQELDPEQRKLLLDRAEAAMRRFRR